MNATKSWASCVVPAILAPEGRCWEGVSAESVDRMRAGLAPLYPDLAALWSQELAAGRACNHACEVHGDESRQAREAHRAYNAAWDRAAAHARTVLKCSPIVLQVVCS